jgi:hypothetical protein
MVMADAGYVLITDVADIEINCIEMIPAVGGISVVKQTVRKTEVPGTTPPPPPKILAFVCLHKTVLLFLVPH